MERFKSSRDVQAWFPFRRLPVWNNAKQNLVNGDTSKEDVATSGPSIVLKNILRQLYAGKKMVASRPQRLHIRKARCKQVG